MVVSQGLIDHFERSIDEHVLKGKSELEKGRIFVKWVLINVFELTEEDAENRIIDGSDDYGVDAYFEKGEEIYLIQGKYGTSHSVDAINIFSKDIETVKSIDPKKVKRTEVAIMVNLVKTYEKAIKVVYVTNNKVDKVVKDIEIFDLNRIAQEIWDRIKEPYIGKKENIKILKFFDFNDFIVCVISLKDLGSFIEKTKDFIFESNIRQFLKFYTKVNKGLKITLAENPEKFFYYNNGITIVAKEFKKNDGNFIEIIGPQIVNGAQTSNSILDAWKKSPDLKGEILLTIIKADTAEMQSITRFRNSQNTVKGKDLVSLSDFHKSLKKQLSDLGYFYEIQAGSFSSLSKAEKLRYRGDGIYNQYLPSDQDNNVPSKDAIQSYVAGFWQNPTDAYQYFSQFMPTGDKYNVVFPSDMKEDYRLLFYPFLIKEYAKTNLGYGRGGAGGGKQYASLFFVAVYFNILISKLLKHEKDYINVELEKVKNIFLNLDFNKKVLLLTDEVVSQFLTQGDVIIKIDKLGDPANFFKVYSYKDEFKEKILENVLLNHIFKKNIETLKEEIVVKSNE